ncbi:MAG: hypothetical protein HOE54_12275, partial [Gammaproteobacteria bacterium]|nr:hypothetical protein [Gammaproteobacteria bacterium]
ETQAVAVALFGAPVRLFPRSNPVFYLSRYPDAAEKGEPLFVSLEYSVTSDGKVSQVKILERNVPNEHVKSLRLRIRGARYRPRIIDAEIIATEGLMLYQPFQVLAKETSSPAPEPVADLEEPIEEPIEGPTDVPTEQ